tara:strand:+ start:56662 stop:59070 length:2409 start_codon:yes stop_codon:yes gene_type:complete
MHSNLKLLGFFLWLAIPFIGLSQDLILVDYASKQPIYGVHIFNLNATKSTVSDTNGKADISEFNANELLVISHTSYTQILFKKQDLYSTHYYLELHPTVLNLDEFIFSATKRGQAKEEVPNRLVTVNAESIKWDDPQTTADVIASTGQVYVQKSQLGGGSPMIRGFSANKVLIVVDGVRMNNAIFRGGNLQNIISIDPNYIEKSEIVFGPGSVMYGSDALGGVMDFQTISTHFSDSTIQTTGNAMMRFSSSNLELAPHLDFSISGKRWSSVTSISYNKFADLKMGTNGPEEYLRKDYVHTVNGIDQMQNNSNPITQIESGYSSLNLLQKLGFKWNKNILINYTFLFSNTSNIPRYDRLIQRKDESTLKYAQWNYGPQKWMMNQLALNINKPNALFDNLKATISVQNFEESRINRKFNNPNRSTKIEKVSMLSANLDFDNAISGRSTLYYGIESIYNGVNSNATNDSLGITTSIITRYPDGSKYFSNSAYLNFKVNYSSKTTMIYGMRYNQTRINAELDTNFYKSVETSHINQNLGALTGSLGIAHRPNPTTQINLNASSGYKAPNIDDIAKVFDSQPGTVIIPNPDLKPEYLYSIDALIEKYWNQERNFKMELSGFYSFLVDALVQRPVQFNGQDSIVYDGTLSQVESTVNTGSAILTGFSFGLEATLYKPLKVTGHLTYTYGVDNEGNNLRHVSPLFANAHLIYTHKKWRINAYVIYNGQISNSKMAPTELKKPHIYLADINGNLYSPSWYTLNIKSAINITKTILFTAGIENITNQRYRPYSSGITSPGINFIASVKATF